MNVPNTNVIAVDNNRRSSLVSPNTLRNNISILEGNTSPKLPAKDVNPAMPVELNNPMTGNYNPNFAVNNNMNNNNDIHGNEPISSVNNQNANYNPSNNLSYVNISNNPSNNLNYVNISNNPPTNTIYNNLNVVENAPIKNQDEIVKKDTLPGFNDVNQGINRGASRDINVGENIDVPNNNSNTGNQGQSVPQTYQSFQPYVPQYNQPQPNQGGVYNSMQNLPNSNPYPSLQPNQNLPNNNVPQEQLQRVTENKDVEELDNEF